MNSNSTGKKSKKFVFGVTIPIMAIALIVGLIVFKAYYIVDPGHRGVVVQLGAVQSKVLSEGFHFIVPFIQEVIPLEIRVQKVQSEETTSSKDLQVVNTVIAVNFRLDPNNVNKLYQEVGLYYKERIVDPAIAESLKAVTAQYTAEELISKDQKSALRLKIY